MILHSLRPQTLANGLGSGGGQVLRVLAFYFNDPSSNPAEVYNFSVKLNLEKNENKQKEAGVGPFKKNILAKVRTNLASYNRRLYYSPKVNF